VPLVDETVSMRILEIEMQLTAPNLIERFVGMHLIYATTISDGELKVVGRGPTPESSHEAAHMKWALAQLVASIGNAN